MDVQCTDKYRRLNRYETSLYGDGLSTLGPRRTCPHSNVSILWIDFVDGSRRMSCR
jgi:hypothetical protein